MSLLCALIFHLQKTKQNTYRNAYLDALSDELKQRDIGEDSPAVHDDLAGDLILLLIVVGGY